jgi:hypothetical protein
MTYYDEGRIKKIILDPYSHSTGEVEIVEYVFESTLIEKLFQDENYYRHDPSKEKVKCVYFDYIDRGVYNLEDFLHGVANNYPNVETLFWSQNYGTADKEVYRKEFKSFAKEAPNCKFILIKDFQTKRTTVP